VSERGQRGIWSRLYNGETQIRFISRVKLWFALSGIVILIGLAALFTRGLNLGIDFEGGVSWEAPAGGASEDDVLAAVEAAGLDEAEVQTLGSSDGDVIRVQAEEVEGEAREEVTSAIGEETDADRGDISFNEVGPSWGSEISEKALRALIVFLVIVGLYIALRFEWKMAVATLAALIHDILVTVGVYAVFGLQVTPATVIAFLTILGYSIYDGIVVFDRVDENAKRLATTGSTTYSQMVNDSMNQVLMRTLNTSITALLPILSLLVVGSQILGATTLEEFALALFIGLLSGAYSSIFIASPLLAVLKEREAKWVAVRRRLEGRGGLVPPVAASVGGPAGVVVEGDDAPPAATPPSSPAPAPSKGPIQPRGRKKGRRG
jgi:preprotein translocase subunit SecF